MPAEGRAPAPLPRWMRSTCRSAPAFATYSPQPMGCAPVTIVPIPRRTRVTWELGITQRARWTFRARWAHGTPPRSDPADAALARPPPAGAARCRDVGATRAARRSGEPATRALRTPGHPHHRDRCRRRALPRRSHPRGGRPVRGADAGRSPSPRHVPVAPWHAGPRQRHRPVPTRLLGLRPPFSRAGAQAGRDLPFPHARLADRRPERPADHESRAHVEGSRAISGSGAACRGGRSSGENAATSLRGAQHPWTSVRELAEHCTGPHSARLRAALADVRAGADSPMETRLRLAFARAGLPAPLLNQPMVAADGRALHSPDFSWPRWRVCGEYEGRTHSAPDQITKDIARTLRAEAAGWVELRFAAPDAANDCARAVHRTREALLARGWVG